MKKSKLIEILNSIEGNPEIKLWNGFAGDWVDIDPKFVKSDLARMTKKYYVESCHNEDRIERRDWDYKMPADEVARLEKNYPKVCKWEMNEYVTEEDIKTKRYSKKTVFIMQAKIKGEKTWDRAGNISY